MRFPTFRCCCSSLTGAIAVCLVMTGLSCSVTAQELLGYWQLEETDIGEEAVDSSGNGFNGEYEGDVDPDVEGAPGFGSGAYFDGATARIYLGPGDENGFGDLTSDFSVMAWINPDQFAHKNRVFGGFPVGGGWGWGTNGSSLEITTYGVKDFDQAVPLELDEWTHAAVVLDADNGAHFYANGEFIGTQTHSAEGNPTFNDFFIGSSCCNTEFFSGLLDEVGVFSGTLTEDQIVNAMNLGVSNFDGGGNPLDPLDDGTLTGQQERADYVHDVLGTWVGDSNLDGEFNSTDFVEVFTAGQYEDGVDGNSSWVTGDWSGDKEFDSGDFVAAFTDGGFEQGPYVEGMQAVPEPSSIVLLLIGSLIFLRRRN